MYYVAAFGPGAATALFERTPLDQLLTQCATDLEDIESRNQMNLFDYSNLKFLPWLIVP